MFDIEKLSALLEEDKAFAEKYSKIETVKEAVEALCEKGFEVTEEEFVAIV